MTLPREASKSTEELRKLNGWFEAEDAAIMKSETLTKEAKKKRRDELAREYRERWTVAAEAARKDLEEWTEIYESRAEKAWQPKMPEDRDARVLKALELQRLSNRIERHREQPGPLLAEYERAVRDGNAVVAYELEEALPALLPDSERRNFEQLARENRLARMNGDDRKRVAEAEEWKRQADEAGVGLALQDANRQRGYVPRSITETTLVDRHQPGHQVQVEEVPNPRWRDSSRDLPANEPTGGTIVPDPGNRGDAA
jgi:hypothetical protein